MINIDGSMGEGGGQVLRTALSLSCLTGKPFRIFNIRKNRAKPGLMRQHLVAVQSGARISAAEVHGDQLGSRELSFAPGPVRSGDYRFDIGTAGSTPLVLQTLIPTLISTGNVSRVTLTGGTHVPFSPSAHYISDIFAPALARLGVRLEVTLDTCGFYPKGGGTLRCRIHPCRQLSPLQLQERGELLGISCLSAVANLPESIAARQAQAALRRLRENLGVSARIETVTRSLSAFGPGSFVFLKARYQQGLAGFTSLGARGKPAEVVGEEAAAALLVHHASARPVDPYLADQLVLYLARASGPSRIATSCLTLHLETNLQVTGYFLDFRFTMDGERGGPGTVTIEPAPGLP